MFPSVPARLGRMVLVLVALLPVLAGVGVTGAPAAASQPSFTPEERAAAITRPAVVYLEVEWEGWVRDKRDGQLWDNQSVSFVNRCTGFVVSEVGFVVTAGHCIDPGIEGAAPIFFETIVQRYVDAGVIDASESAAMYTDVAENSEVEGLAAGDPPTRNVYVQRGVAVSGLRTGEAFAARVIDFSPVSRGDVGLIKVDETDLPAVALAEGQVPVGTEILAIGYPGSADDISDSTLEPSSKDGTISNLRTDGGVPIYETSAAMTGGMSGGPVVNMDGLVVGLVSRGPADETQAFNFAAASSLIAEMLASNGVTNQLSETDRQYREALDAYFAGRYSDAIESFDAVLAQIPSHQQAQEFRELAVERQQSEGDAGEDAADDGGGISGWVIAAVAGGLLLLLVVAALVLILLMVARGRRRRQAPAAAQPAPPAAQPAPPAAQPAPPAAPPPAAQPVPLAAQPAPQAPYPPPSGPQPAAGPFDPAHPTSGPTGPNAHAARPATSPADTVEFAAATGTTAPSVATAPDTPAAGREPGGSYCGNCGAAVKADGRFCTQCGAPLT